jgi:RNA-directed DNA polymerase
MTKASGNLQDLRRGIYVKAKAEPSWRFWGLYVHVCKMETLQQAYSLAKKNDGAPGIDGVTFEAIEAQGVAVWTASSSMAGNDIHLGRLAGDECRCLVGHGDGSG